MSDLTPGVVRGELEREAERRGEVEHLRKMLRDVAASATTFDDPRVGYVEVQIDRPLWDAIRQEAR